MTTTTPDVNVLLAAYRADHAHHGVARAWLEAQLAACGQGGRLLLLPMVCTAFVRLVTHHKIFAVPATADEALDFVDALLAYPGCDLADVSAWPGFAALCRGKGLSGNAVPDAWIAAAARASGAHLVTFDQDFTQLMQTHEVTLLRPRQPVRS